MGLVADSGRSLVAVTLADALAAAVEGAGRLVVLVGEAGIGKTTAARDLTATARRAGATVRWSACSVGGGTIAHAPWLNLLAGLGDPGRQAMSALLGTDPGEGAAAAARASAYAGVVAALEAASRDAPMVLVLDDLHWADEGSIHLLDVVAAHLPALPVLLVGTYRDTDLPPGSALTRLGGRADRVPLRGLDAAGVAAALSAQLGATRAAELAERVLELTAGNPFLVVQVARLLADDPSALEGGALPGGARDLLEQRLAGLTTGDRAVVRSAAVLGSPFGSTLLTQMVGADEAAVETVLGRAAALRVVERAAGTRTWRFVHDLFRQAAVAGADPAEVQVLHERAARALEQAGAEPAEIAAHLHAAAPEHRRAASTWSVRAGDRALGALGWEEAATHFERALAALDRTDALEVRAEALVGLGRARLLCGDGPGAARSFEELAGLARHHGSAELLAQAALGFSADLAGFEVRLFDQHQIDLLEEAAAALAGEHSPALRASVLARLSVAISLAAPDARRLELADTAVSLARQSGDPSVLARALAAHCDAIAGPDQVERREREATEIIEIAEHLGDGPLELLGRRLRYVARLEQADIAGVDEDATAFARRAQAIGNPLYSWLVPLWQAQTALVAGDLERAERLAGEVEQLSRAAGSLNGVVLATVLRLVAGWQRADYTGTAELMANMSETSPDVASQISSIGGFAWNLAQAGREVEAAALLDRAASLGLDEQTADAEWLSNLVTVVRTAAVLDHPILGPAVDLLVPYAHLVAFEGLGAGLHGSVARFVAVGCLALGRLDEAVGYAEAAVAVNRSFGGVLLADALRTMADCLLARDPADPRAEELHAEADRGYAAAGTMHLVRRGREPAGAPASRAAGLEPPNEMRRDGDVWHLTYAGQAAIIKHSKGLADLARLVVRPGQDVHVAELEDVPLAALTRTGDALDRRAIAAYRDRLTELSQELDDAEAAHDLGRVERARLEHDALVEQLAGAVGLGGRARSAGPEPVERLRKAVSARLRDAIKRIGAVHEPLGRHLHHAIRTGTYCAYQPEVPTDWRRQTGSGATRS